MSSGETSIHFARVLEDAKEVQQDELKEIKKAITTIQKGNAIKVLIIP